MSSPLYESEESDDEVRTEDATSKGSPALGRGQRLIHDKPRNKVEEFIAMNRGFTDHRHEQKSLISPHASEMLAHWHVFLRDLLRRSLTVVILAGHEIDRIYRKGRKPLQGFGRQRSAKEQLRVEMCSRPKPSAGI